MTTVLTKPMFEATIDDLNGDMVHVMESELNTQRLAKNAGPSNDEIIKAARAHYIQYSDFIDNNAYFTRDYSTEHENKGRIKDLNICDWDKNPISSLIEEIEEKAALNTNTAGSEFIFPSMTVGINADSELSLGGGGGVGAIIDRAIQSSEGTRFFSYYMGKAGLLINVDDNFMMGGFKDHPSVLRDLHFYGLEVSIDLGVAVKLDLFLDKNLEFLGFTTSVGGGIEKEASIIAGHFHTK